MDEVSLFVAQDFQTINQPEQRNQSKPMKNKLSPDEKKRIKEHGRMAPPIPKQRQVRSLEGQKYFNFDTPAPAKVAA